jgi:hypothetical protein
MSVHIWNEKYSYLINEVFIPNYYGVREIQKLVKNKNITENEKLKEK